MRFVIVSLLGVLLTFFVIFLVYIDVIPNAFGVAGPIMGLLFILVERILYYIKSVQSK